MRNNKILILLSALLVLGFAVSCSSTGAPYAEAVVEVSGDVVSGPDFTATSYGNTLKVQLDSNATTGYQWSASASDDLMVELTSEDYVADDNGSAHGLLGGAVGVGGTTFYEFKALSPGKVTLTFSYARSWENSAVKEVKLYLLIDKGLSFTIADYEEN